MNPGKGALGLAALLITFLAGASVSAQTVYKTVEDGVPSFSDTPPADGEAEIIAVEPPAPATDGVYQANQEAMRATTERMIADREAREEARAEARAAAETATVTDSSGDDLIETWSHPYWPRQAGEKNRTRPPFRVQPIEPVHPVHPGQAGAIGRGPVMPRTVVPRR